MMIKVWTSCVFCGQTDEQTAKSMFDITNDLLDKGWRSVMGANACPACAKEHEDAISRMQVLFNVQFNRIYEKVAETEEEAAEEKERMSHD